MKLLLIEDDRESARFIRSGLARAGMECDVAPTGEKGLKLLAAGDYALAIVDVMLPDITGIEVIRRTRASGRTIPLIILSAMTDTSFKVSGLNLGADDYLTKPFAMDELIARVNAHLRRITSDDTLAFEDLTLDPVRSKAVRGTREIDLTALECKLLTYLMRNPGRIVSSRTIMERIWDYRATAASNVVEARIHCLRRKLTDGGERDLIVTIRNLGYVLKAD